ncbi:MAG: hypothetical protein Q9182_001069 [Xanthomendoza sp. 2 TL-2023]
MGLSLSDIRDDSRTRDASKGVDTARSCVCPGLNELRKMLLDLWHLKIAEGPAVYEYEPPRKLLREEIWEKVQQDWANQDDEAKKSYTPETDELVNKAVTKVLNSWVKLWMYEEPRPAENEERLYVLSMRIDFCRFNKILKVLENLSTTCALFSLQAFLSTRSPSYPICFNLKNHRCLILPSNLDMSPILRPQHIMREILVDLRFPHYHHPSHDLFQKLLYERTRFLRAALRFKAGGAIGVDLFLVIDVEIRGNEGFEKFVEGVWSDYLRSCENWRWNDMDGIMATFCSSAMEKDQIVELTYTSILLAATGSV